MRKGNRRVVAMLLAALMVFSSIQFPTINAQAKEAAGGKLITDGMYEAVSVKGEVNGGKVRWIIDADGRLYVEGEGDFLSYGDGRQQPGEVTVSGNMHQPEKMPPWLEEGYAETIKSAKVRLTDITVLSQFFCGCSNLAQVDLQELDASGVKNIAQMYSGCSSLKTADISMFANHKLERMHGLFAGCSDLESVDLGEVDTALVDDMSGVFHGCVKLKTIDLGHFNTEKVRFMEHMFEGCASLTTLDLGMMELPELQDGDTRDMLKDCTGLETIVAPKHLAQLPIPLPEVEGMAWYRQDDGRVVTELPKGQEQAVTLVRRALGDPGNDPEPGTGKLITDEMYEAAGIRGEANSGKVRWIIDASGKLYVEGEGEFLLDDEDMMPIPGAGGAAGTGTGGASGSGAADDPATDPERMRAEKIPPWIAEGYADRITEAEVSLKGTTVISRFFDNCTNLKKVDFTKLDAGSVTNIAQMFNNCPALQTVDMSMFHYPGKLEYVHGLFAGCIALQSVNLTGFNTSGVRDLSGMFYGCASLTSLDLGSFDTSNVRYMSDAFSDCSGLTELNVSGFNTENMICASMLFAGCSGLTSLDLSNFDFGKIKEGYINEFLQGCTNLETIKAPKNLAVVQLPELPVVEGKSWHISDSDEIVTVLPKNLRQSVTLVRRALGDPGNDPEPGTGKLITNEMYNDASNIAKGTENNGKVRWIIDANGKLYVEGEGDFLLDDIVMPMPGTGRASGTGTGGASGTGTGGASGTGAADDPATDPERMRTEKIPPWIAQGYAREITEAEISLKGTTVISRFFDNCTNLRKVDFTKLDAGSVTNIAQMFNNCPALQTVDMSMFHYPGKLEYVHGLFAGCSALKSVDLTGFNTSGVRDLSGLFDGCVSLTSLDLSSFDTSKVRYMSDTFSGCAGLTELNVSGFNTENMICASMLFAGCSGLESLDLSNFDFGKIKEGYIDGFLQGCTNLETIKAPKNLAVAQSPELPVVSGKSWYRSDTAEEVTRLPLGLAASVTLTRVKPDKPQDDPDDPNKPQEPEPPKNIQIAGISVGDVVYNGKSVSYSGRPVVTVDGRVMTAPKLTYTYSGIMADGSIYEDSDTAPKNAGNYTLEIGVCDKNGQSLGSSKYSYRIRQAALTISAMDMLLYQSELRSLPISGEYDVTGLIGSDRLIKEPVFTYTDMSGKEIDGSDASLLQPGDYQVIPAGADAGMNYEIFYIPGKAALFGGKVYYTVSFDMNGHGNRLRPIIGISPGSLIAMPETPVENGYRFMGWYKDNECKRIWNFAEDTVQEDVTLYACWLAQVSESGEGLCIQEVTGAFYTGSAVKPQIMVYSADGRKLLKAGKDYTIQYYNNIDADAPGQERLGGMNRTGKEGENGFTSALPYMVITGIGNYQGTLYYNFHILPVSIADVDGEPAQGFTLKYTEQLTVNAKKAQKTLNSLRWKKAMQAGRDYAATLTTVNAFDGQGRALASGIVLDGNSENPMIPAGYKGSFRLTLNGIGNFTGTIQKDVYVSEKTHLMKNAKVTLGKNIKAIKYTTQRQLKEGITLTPAYYDTDKKSYYLVNGNGIVSTRPEADGNNVFVVKCGTDYLVYGRDYTVDYVNNREVGTATLVLTGIGEYAGTKNVNFKIAGMAFTAGNIAVEGLQASMAYTGNALTQNKVVLYPKDKTVADALQYGIHYTISYKNNVKKGTATMTFTAKPESGYSGKFTKTFKITGTKLADSVNVVAVASMDPEDCVRPMGENDLRFEGTVMYTEGGTKITDRVQLINRATGIELVAGKDYKVSYKNNKALCDGESESSAYMLLTGKGNYTGTVKVYFAITPALIARENITMNGIALNEKASYQYKPAVTVMNEAKKLKAGANKDYQVTYQNNDQANVTAWVGGEADAVRPTAVLTTPEGSKYRFTDANGNACTELTLPLMVYQTELKKTEIYIVMEDVFYTGSQRRPSGEALKVYLGTAAAVNAATKAGEKKEEVLTAQDGAYQLKRLEEGVDYALSYGENIEAGVNKGSVILTGVAPRYGGRITHWFTIIQKNVY